MITETYRGRKIKARKGKKWGTILVTCNGELVSSPTGTDLAKALDSVKATIDFVDREPVNGNRWGANWYAPGSYEMCPEGIHPQEIGGQCQHFTCIAKRTAARRMTSEQAHQATQAAGAAYDAAVRAVWAAIPAGLATQQAWNLARPGMAAAQQALDAELARIRSEVGKPPT